MAWELIGEGCFYRNNFLLNLGFPNFITTVKAGDIKRNKLKNIFIGEQLHSANFEEVYSPLCFSSSFLNNDGFFTKTRNLWMGVFTADCIPVFIVSQNLEVAAILHSGWQGIEKDICGKFISYFLARENLLIKDFFVVIGPHINKECYEVGVEFKDKFLLDEIFLKGERKYFLDMQKNLRLKLLALGISADQFKGTDICTYHQEDFFSYRETKTAARMLSGLQIKNNRFNLSEI